MGIVTHYDIMQMLTWLPDSRKEPHFTVTVQSDSAPFNYSFTPYITAGQSFWVDWGDGSEETFTTASTAEKTHEYSSRGTYTVRMRGSVGINRVRISPTDAGQAALVIGSNGNLDKLGTITVTDEMFRDCPNLAMAELTGGITSIGTLTFYGCTNLALTSLPEGVTSIGTSAFANCTKLAPRSLPEGVTSISDKAFNGCTSIDNLVFFGTPTSIASDAFTLSGANLFVTWSSGAVADAPWGAASVTYDYTPVAKYYVTVTDGQTHTIQSLGVSAATVVDWGDGLSNEYTGTALRTHVYAGAGTYCVEIYTPENVTVFDLRDRAAVSLLNSSDLAPMVNVRTFYLRDLPNATITLNSADMVDWRPSTFTLYNLTNATITLNSADMVDWRPSNFTLYNLTNATGTINSADMVDWLPYTFYLHNLTNATGTINSADMVDWRPSTFYLNNLPNATITINSADMVDWRPSTFYLLNIPNITITIAPSSIKNWDALTELQLRTGNLTQPQADLVLWECYQIVRTKTGGTIRMDYAGNAAPSGVFQPCQNPPVSATTPGKEVAYELLNDSLGKGFNKWATVTTN